MGSSINDCKILKKPINNRIWLVGEHLAETEIGNVHGAWSVGAAAALEAITYLE